ncbi:hypothetical protein B0J13DRAFT_517431 [Dactylonectria estremocensis]|uniref:BTB domain-containing protein n=1 Tax=Dactylonectria estremocensis TaxID=1079267 RepID=A0A9P9FIL3_9HYPO|nr:hypothetical protein B0J13DRAFT_517431 [Dactylonectria estremocensis]
MSTMGDDQNPGQVADESITDPGADVEMSESTELRKVADGGEGDGTAKDANGDEEQAADTESVPSRISFATYLQSPIVTLLVGSPDGEKTTLTTHQALLSQVAYFHDIFEAFADDDSLRRRPRLTIVAQPRQIELTEFDVDAVGFFLEYLYTGEYFPKKLPGQRVLESDPEVPAVDSNGDQLLKHARVYTLAEKLGVPGLKSLASSKIHCVNSTAKGEIAYARYVYAYTDTDDTTIRAPVASFWATRSHTLRAEAEEEFRALCLEHPQFGYDVLTRVLDDKLKRERTEKMHPGSGSHRKRARHSTGAREL